jgi:hypothetical protein
MEAYLGALENHSRALAALTGAVEVHAKAVKALPGLWKHTESHEGLFWSHRESPRSKEDSHWSVKVLAGALEAHPGASDTLTGAEECLGSWGVGTLRATKAYPMP